jgi:glutamate decarboxylase
MVHINRVATAKEVADEKNRFEPINNTSSIDLTPEDEADDFTATVYGSKYAAEDLPRHEMPVSPPIISHFGTIWKAKTFS